MKTSNFTCLLLTVLLSCADKQLESDPLLVQRLQEEVISGDSIIDLSRVTEFSWDSLLILTPYTELARIERELSIDLSLIKPSPIEFNDGINQLVFFDKGLPIKMIEYPRYPGDFADGKHKVEFIKREKALFEVVITDEKTSDGKDWIQLRRE